MPEKQQQPETCTVINDTSQGSVAGWLRCGGIFCEYFVTNLLLSLPWKNFKNQSISGEVMGKKVDCIMHHVCEHSPAERWRTCM